jgi:hypothetical protein
MSASAINVSNSKRRSRRFAFGTCEKLVRAIRPLAASARLAVLEANAIQGCARSGSPASFTAGRLNCLYSRSFVWPGSLPHGFVQGLCSLAGSHARRSLPFGRNKRVVAGSAERIRMQGTGCAQSAA